MDRETCKLIQNAISITSARDPDVQEAIVFGQMNAYNNMQSYLRFSYHFSGSHRGNAHSLRILLSITNNILSQSKYWIYLVMLYLVKVILFTPLH